MNARLGGTEEKILEYMITYPNGDDQYSEWVPGESMGQAIQFWLDKKAVWVDPLKDQSVGESDIRVDVSDATVVPISSKI